MMQGKTQSILRRSMQLSLGALLLAVPMTGQSVSAQKTAAKSTLDYTHNVDPFIGVDWGGNTFVGSAIPYGLVKLGPDMETFDGRRSGFGYSSNGVILGFSHLHLVTHLHRGAKRTQRPQPERDPQQPSQAQAVFSSRQEKDTPSGQQRRLHTGTP